MEAHAADLPEILPGGRLRPCCPRLWLHLTSSTRLRPHLIPACPLCTQGAPESKDAGDSLASAAVVTATVRMRAGVGGKTKPSSWGVRVISRYQKGEELRGRALTPTLRCSQDRPRQGQWEGIKALTEVGPRQRCRRDHAGVTGKHRSGGWQHAVFWGGRVGELGL